MFHLTLESGHYFVWFQALPLVFVLTVVGALLATWLTSSSRSGRSSNPWRGKTVLITGAARGLGRSLAKKFDKLGCRLVLWDIDTEGLDSLKLRLNPTVLHVYQKVDVADMAQIEDHLSKSPLGHIDVVIANAGIIHGKNINDLSVKEYERTIYVNLFQIFYVFKAMRKRFNIEPSEIPPTFVMVSSVCGMMALTNLADYCASKFAVVGLAEGIRLDMRKTRSPLNTLLVMPFLINTKMFNGVKIKRPASWFLQPLDKSETADSIIDAIRRKKSWLVMPWILHFAPIMLVLPISIRNCLYDLIGESTYMDNYHKVNRALEARKMESILSAPLPDKPTRKIR